MAKHWTKDCTVIRGVVRLHDLAYLALVEDELAEEKIPHTFFAEWDRGKWLDAGKVKWDTVSMAICCSPKEQMIAIGEYGKAWLCGSGDKHEETIMDGENSPKARGTLRCVRCIDGVAYAAGMDRQVYRRDGVKRWVCIDQSMRPDQNNDDVVGFEGIDGFSARDIYGGGWDGELWRYDGRHWKQLPSPTNLTLTNLICAGDEYVYACGRNGLLIRGRGNRWKVIEQESTAEDLWGMEWYDGKLWVASLEQLYILQGSELTPVDFGDNHPATCSVLSSRDGVLWSVGPKDVMCLERNQWIRID